MSFTISQIKNHLIGLGHGGTLNKVRNINEMFERSAARFLLKLHPVESMRTAALANVIHDDVFNYALPDDFGSLIDLIPQDNRQLWDKAVRDNAGQFDLQKAVKNKVVSIEGSEGAKIARINWRSRQGKVLHNMDSVTANGTWSAVNTASSISANTIFKKSGSASIEFNVVSSGDGIKNTTMTPVNLTDEDEVADVFVWLFLPSAPTSVTARWGNDLTANYWTSTAQTTQADGSAFKTGWNLLKFSWASATETGTVAPATIDSFQITIAGSAMNNVRVDNIIFSIGRNFDVKYYSKYLYKNSTGTWISAPTSNDDVVLVDNDSLPQFLMELLIDMAHQTEGSDSTFDIDFAENQLARLYPAYKAINPSQVQKVARGYGNKKVSRGRW